MSVNAVEVVPGIKAQYPSVSSAHHRDMTPRCWDDALDGKW